MRIVKPGNTPEVIDLAGRKMRGTCDKCKSRIEADGSEFVEVGWSSTFGYAAHGNCPVCGGSIYFKRPWWLWPGNWLVGVCLLPAWAVIFYAIWKWVNL